MLGNPMEVAPNTRKSTDGERTLYTERLVPSLPAAWPGIVMLLMISILGHPVYAGFGVYGHAGFMSSAVCPSFMFQHLSNVLNKNIRRRTATRPNSALIVPNRPLIALIAADGP